VRVLVSRSIIHQLALRYGKVYEIRILLVILVMEGVHQDEGIALYIQAILGNVVVGANQFANPLAPIPKLHCNLLILGSCVVQMGIPFEIECLFYIAIRVFPLLYLPKD
jgi:hypothetical protein